MKIRSGFIFKNDAIYDPALNTTSKINITKMHTIFFFKTKNLNELKKIIFFLFHFKVLVL